MNCDVHSSPGGMRNVKEKYNNFKKKFNVKSSISPNKDDNTWNMCDFVLICSQQLAVQWFYFGFCSSANEKKKNPQQKHREIRLKFDL